MVAALVVSHSRLRGLRGDVARPPVRLSQACVDEKVASTSDF